MLWFLFGQGGVLLGQGWSEMGPNGVHIYSTGSVNILINIQCMEVQEEGTFRKRKHTASFTAQFTGKVVKIQRFYRHHACRRLLRKLIKRKKAKEQIALELVITEKSYCENLRAIVEQVLEPSRSIIDDEEMHRILFSSLAEIYHMHQHFLQKLEPAMQEYSHHGTRLSPIISEELFGKDDFKLKYSNYCANYKKSTQIAKLLFVNNSGFSALLRKAGLTQVNLLESELIKPMQRLCKYELLLSSYLKNTEPDHLDFAGLEATLGLIEKMVRETNEQVEQFLLEEKCKQIFYHFGQHLTRVDRPNRKLLFTIEDISVIDMINDSSTVFKELDLFNDTVFLIPVSNAKPILCDLTLVRDLPNLKYFKNLVQIANSDRYLTIEFKKQKSKINFLEAVKKTDIRSKSSSFVSVSILGTEIRESLFKNYTVYIVSVEFNNATVKKIYPRFNDLLRVQQIVESRKIKINLPYLSRAACFNTTKSKTIEKRKILIQQFLEKLLNCRECYEITEVFKILNLSLKENSKKTQEQVAVSLPSAELIHTLIDVKNSTLRDLKQAIAHQLGLADASQFEIFEMRNKMRRLMHDDEMVSQIRDNQKGFNFNPFKENAAYLFTRHHYMDPDDEFLLYESDQVRTELELSVIKSEVLKYRLEEELMITFMCFFAIYICLPVDDDVKLTAYIKDICRKEYKVSKQQFRAYYAQAEKKLEEMEDSDEKLPIVIIKVISNSPLYRCQQFEVQVHPKSYKAVKTYILGLEEKIILGIKTSHILLLTAESKHIMQSFTLDMVEIAEVHPTALILQISTIGPVLRLNTEHAFQICKLINIYKAKA